MHYEGKNSLWIPDLYISNLRTLTNTGFLDHPGIKLDVASNKRVYYSRYAQVIPYSFSENHRNKAVRILLYR